MQRSHKSLLSVVSSLLPNVVNNDTDGTGVGVDLRGYGSALAIFHVGQSGDTLSGSVTLQLRLQHSDQLASGYVDVPAAEVDGVGQALLIDDAAEDEILLVLAYLGSKRYLRAFVDVAGTHTNGTPCSACIVRGLPTYAS